MLTIRELTRVKTAIQESFDVSQVEEVTIEANPEDVTPEWLKGLAGMNFFNRISIGVQSFNDEDLRVINRRHNAFQSVAAIRNATEAGFDNLSIDLIMGLPRLTEHHTPHSVSSEQSLQTWHNNLKILDTLLPLGSVKHISCYELTVEEGTILDRQLRRAEDGERRTENGERWLKLPDEEVVAEEYETLQQWCAQRGFCQYEVSNFALPGWHSRHNSRYWDRTPYIGVGTGAHSFDGKCRRWNLADIQAYIAGAERGDVPFGEERVSDDGITNHRRHQQGPPVVALPRVRQISCHPDREIQVPSPHNRDPRFLQAHPQRPPPSRRYCLHPIYCLVTLPPRSPYPW